MLTERHVSSRATEQATQQAARVRPGRCQDVSWMLPLWTAMMEGHAARDGAFTLTDDAPHIWQQSIWDLMARQDSFVFVVPTSGFCCGWVSRHPAIYAQREVGLLSEICVGEGARRRGVGRSLMEAAKAWFLARDVDDFQLATAAFNKRGQRFFEALGGRPILLRYHFDLSAL